MKLKLLGFSLGSVMCLTTNTLFANSSFLDYVSQYEVVKVDHISGVDCSKNGSTACVKNSDLVEIQSSDSEAIVEVIEAISGRKLSAKKMTEYDISGEGRFSYAKFTRTSKGAKWMSSSTSSSGSWVILEHLENDLYHLELVLNMRPYDRRVFKLILKKK